MRPSERRLLLVLFGAHFAVSVACFVGLYGWGVAVQDAGVDGSASLAERVLRYGLLQPLAHWVLLGIDVRWWQWSGLFLLLGILAANSLAVAALLGAARAVRRLS